MASSISQPLKSEFRRLMTSKMLPMIRDYTGELDSRSTLSYGSKVEKKIHQGECVFHMPFDFTYHFNVMFKNSFFSSCLSLYSVMF